MDDYEAVTCPWCLETVEIAIPLDAVGEQVQDCDVCCRPWRVVVGRDEDGGLILTVDPL